MASEEQLTTPELESGRLGEIFDHMHAIAQSRVGHAEETFALPQTARFDDIGKITWLQIGEDLSIRITQQHAVNGPEGVEIAVNFKVIETDEAPTVELSPDENPFTITVPTGEQSGATSYFTITRSEDGTYQPDQLIDPNDLEAYTDFAEHMAEYEVSNNPEQV